MKKNGFTLIELMAVVALLGILSAVSLPIYSNHEKETKLSEIPAIVRLAENAADNYFADTRSFAGADCSKATSSSYWKSSCEGNASTFNVAVVGVGSMAGFSFAQTMAGARTSSVPSTFSPTTTGNCFILRKNGGC